jgi:hypothetical protein
MNLKKLIGPMFLILGVILSVFAVGNFVFVYYETYYRHGLLGNMCTMIGSGSLCFGLIFILCGIVFLIVFWKKRKDEDNLEM